MWHQNGTIDYQEIQERSILWFPWAQKKVLEHPICDVDPMFVYYFPNNTHIALQKPSRWQRNSWFPLKLNFLDFHHWNLHGHQKWVRKIPRNSIRWNDLWSHHWKTKHQLAQESIWLLALQVLKVHRAWRKKRRTEIQLGDQCTNIWYWEL